ncbi:MAG TPA: SMC-Scp complex subunit ScpB [Bacillota bacterium]|nr:SMC-Scp complex subunit ScpB [Bacillota bacterium]
MTVLFHDETKAVLECLLFVASEPLTLKRMAQVAEIDVKDAQELINELQQDYRQGKRGLQIIEIANGYQLTSRPELAPYIERLYRPQSAHGLSRAALETLAIVAYKQPVTRGDMELIRGVKVDSSINTLVEKGLVKEVGRKEGAGRPVLFGTTDKFLQHFGLRTPADLPSLEEFMVTASESELYAAEQGFPQAGEED